MIALLVLVGCFGPRELEGARYDSGEGCWEQDTLIVDNWYWWTFGGSCKESGLWVPMADGTCWDLNSDCRHGPIDDPAVNWDEAASICTPEVMAAPYCDDQWWMTDTGDTGDTGDSGDTAGG